MMINPELAPRPEPELKFTVQPGKRGDPVVWSCSMCEDRTLDPDQHAAEHGQTSYCVDNKLAAVEWTW
jgi:hypothetical protein